MKKKEKQSLHGKTTAELMVLLKEAREALFGFRRERAQRKLKNTRAIFEKRKNIARIATIIKIKEYAE